MKVEDDIITHLTASQVFKIQLTRKTLCENLRDSNFKDVFTNTVLRFTVNAGKYMMGVVTGTVDCNTPYTVTYQKQIGVDKATKKPIVKDI